MIHAKGLRYAIGDFEIDVSLRIEEGEYFVLLGSTGSGKTLLLECICGLRRAADGIVEVNGADVTDRDPSERGIGYVPQDGALFPHLNVRDNIAFGLRARGVARAVRHTAALEMAGMLGIEYLLDRRVEGLSGGERQRVALARALACKPDLLLLDEPVSALDEFTRDIVCRELVRLQRAMGVAVVHVCHSFEEARMVSDRIGIIGRGSIVQTGTADELVNHPANRYVANILRLNNIFHGRAVAMSDGPGLEVGGVVVPAPEAQDTAEFLVRPWDIHLADGKVTGGRAVLSGKIIAYDLAGAFARVRIDGPMPLEMIVPRREATAANLGPGKVIRVTFGRDAVHLLQNGKE